MATTTTNLGLIKPATTDNVDITVLNGNMDSIDSAVGAGWISLASSATYVDAKTLRISGDLTGKISANMKLKCTNSTAKQGTIASVSYTSPNTTIVLNESVLVSGTITDVYYSTAQNPLGFTKGDYDIEVGTSGIWTYVKKASGLAELYGTLTKNDDIGTVSGVIYRSSAATAQTAYPFTFTAIPTEIVTASGANWMNYITAVPNTVSQSGSYYGSSPVQITSVFAQRYNIIVKGKWK